MLPLKTRFCLWTWQVTLCYSCVILTYANDVLLFLSEFAHCINASSSCNDAAETSSRSQHWANQGTGFRPREPTVMLGRPLLVVAAAIVWGGWWNKVNTSAPYKPLWIGYRSEKKPLRTHLLVIIESVSTRRWWLLSLSNTLHCFIAFLCHIGVTF